MLLKIQIIQGSILDADAQVIVNAANSYGLMGGGVAGVIRQAAGPSVEQEAMQQAPIPVGRAVLTSGGKTPFPGIIHAPTMSEPAMSIPAENVSQATRAAIQFADCQGWTSVALPGMGTGVGGVSHTEAAEHMMNEILSYPSHTLENVILIDVDPAMVQAWQDRVS